LLYRFRRIIVGNNPSLETQELLYPSLLDMGVFLLERIGKPMNSQTTKCGVKMRRFAGEELTDLNATTGRPFTNWVGSSTSAPHADDRESLTDVSAGRWMVDNIYAKS
jgi:hypothetical protein